MERKERRFPLSSWLSDHLTHKMVALIVVIGFVAWLLLCVVFLSRLDEVIRRAYTSALTGEVQEVVIRNIHQQMFLSLTIFSVCIFVGLAVALYLLAIAPIGRLRQAMRRYYEERERPQRTDRRDEVGRLQNAFADLVGVVESKEQAERRLIASISHDIKAPLTSVLGYSQRLHTNHLTAEKQEQYVDLIYEKALRIKAVVDEFDEYLDSGLRDAAPMALTTAGDLCGKLEREYAAEVRDAGVGFTVVCACPQEKLICNWEHMRRLFGNLIDNAFHHARAEHLELSLTCRREGEQLVFLFRDNGVGVPPEMLEQIFEPLYTSDQGRKVSGLGLSICRSIARAHGGTITAENVHEGGLRFRVSLPLAKV